MFVVKLNACIAIQFFFFHFRVAFKRKGDNITYVTHFYRKTIDRLLLYQSIVWQKFPFVFHLHGICVNLLTLQLPNKTYDRK